MHEQIEPIYEWMIKLGCINEAVIDANRDDWDLLLEAGDTNLKHFFKWLKFFIYDPNIDTRELSEEEVKKRGNDFRDFFGVTDNRYNPILIALAHIAYNYLGYEDIVCSENAFGINLFRKMAPLTIMDKADKDNPNSFYSRVRAMVKQAWDNYDPYFLPPMMYFMREFGETVYNQMEKDEEDMVNGHGIEPKPEYGEMHQFTNKEDAYKYGKYTGYVGDGTSDTGQLCYTTNDSQWHNFSNGDRRQLYVVLRNDWRETTPPTREQIKDKQVPDYPKDSYGLSMVWFWIDDNIGMMTNSNVRWNHGHGGFGNVDNQFKVYELSKIIGVNMFKEFNLKSPILEIRKVKERLANGDDFNDIFNSIRKIPDCTKDLYWVTVPTIPGRNILNAETRQLLWDNRFFWLDGGYDFFINGKRMFIIRCDEKNGENFLDENGELLLKNTWNWFSSIRYHRQDAKWVEFYGKVLNKGWNVYTKKGEFLLKDEDDWFYNEPIHANGVTDQSGNDLILVRGNNVGYNFIGEDGVARLQCDGKNPYNVVLYDYRYNDVTCVVSACYMHTNKYKLYNRRLVDMLPPDVSFDDVKCDGSHRNLYCFSKERGCNVLSLYKMEFFVPIESEKWLTDVKGSADNYPGNLIIAEVNPGNFGLISGEDFKFVGGEFYDDITPMSYVYKVKTKDGGYNIVKASGELLFSKETQCLLTDFQFIDWDEYVMVVTRNDGKKTLFMFNTKYDGRDNIDLNFDDDNLWYDEILTGHCYPDGHRGLYYKVIKRGNGGQKVNILDNNLRMIWEGDEWFDSLQPLSFDGAKILVGTLGNKEYLLRANPLQPAQVVFECEAGELDLNNNSITVVKPGSRCSTQICTGRFLFVQGSGEKSPKLLDTKNNKVFQLPKDTFYVRTPDTYSNDMPVYEHIVFLTNEQGKQNAMNTTTGELVSNKWFDNASTYHDGSTEVSIGEGSDAVANYINPSGNLVWKGERWFDSVGYWENGRLPVMFKGLGWNIIRDDGTFVYEKFLGNVNYLSNLNHSPFENSDTHFYEGWTNDCKYRLFDSDGGIHTLDELMNVRGFQLEAVVDDCGDIDLNDKKTLAGNETYLGYPIDKDGLLNYVTKRNGRYALLSDVWFVAVFFEDSKNKTAIVEIDKNYWNPDMGNANDNHLNVINSKGKLLYKGNKKLTRITFKGGCYRIEYKEGRTTKYNYLLPNGKLVFPEKTGTTNGSLKTTHIKNRYVDIRRDKDNPEKVLLVNKETKQPISSILYDEIEELCAGNIYLVGVQCGTTLSRHSPRHGSLYNFLLPNGKLVFDDNMDNWVDWIEYFGDCYCLGWLLMRPKEHGQNFMYTTGEFLWKNNDVWPKLLKLNSEGNFGPYIPYMFNNESGFNYFNTQTGENLINVGRNIVGASEFILRPGTGDKRYSEMNVEGDDCTYWVDEEGYIYRKSDAYKNPDAVPIMDRNGNPINNEQNQENQQDQLDEAIRRLIRKQLRRYLR